MIRQLSRIATPRSIREMFRRHAFVQNVSIVSLTSMIEGLLSFVQGIVVARWLGPSLYGVAELVMSYPSLLFGFLEAQGNAATIKYMGEFRAQGKQRQALAVCKLAYSIGAFLAIFTSVIVALTSSWATTAFVDLPNDAASLMVVFSLSFIPLGLSGPSQAILMIFGEYKLLAMSRVVSVVLRVSLVIGLILAGFGLPALIFGNAAGMALTGILVTGAAQLHLRRTWSTPLWSVRVRELGGWGHDIFRFWMFTRLTQIANSAQKHLGAIILGYFQPPEQVGYFRIAKGIGVMLSSFFSASSRTVVYPDLVRLWSNSEKSPFSRYVIQVVTKVSPVFGGIGILSLLLVPELIPFFAGIAFDPAVNVCRILLVGTAVGMGCFWVQPFYLATAQTGFWFGLSVTSSLVLVPAYVWGAFEGGAMGVAMAHGAIIAGKHVAGGVRAFFFLRGQRNYG